MSAAEHWCEGLFPAPLAKRQTKLVTLSVIIANPPHLDQSPSTRPAPAWGRKTAAPARLPPALDPFLLSRWFACFRQRGWLTRGSNWVHTGNSKEEMGLAPGGEPDEPFAYRRGARRPLLVLDAHKKSPSPHGAPTERSKGRRVAQNGRRVRAGRLSSEKPL